MRGIREMSYWYDDWRGLFVQRLHTVLRDTESAAIPELRAREGAFLECLCLANSSKASPLVVSLLFCGGGQICVSLPTIGGSARAAV